MQCYDVTLMLRVNYQRYWLTQYDVSKERLVCNAHYGLMQHIHQDAETRNKGLTLY